MQKKSIIPAAAMGIGLLLPLFVGVGCHSESLPNPMGPTPPDSNVQVVIVDAFFDTDPRLDVGEAKTSYQIASQEGSATHPLPADKLSALPTQPDENDPPEVPGENDPPEVPGESDPPEVPGESDPPEVPGESDPPEVPGESDPPEVPGESDPPEVPGESDPPEVPGENDTPEVPGYLPPVPGGFPTFLLPQRGHWTFDEKTTGAVTDSSGYGNDGTVYFGVLRAKCDGQGVVAFDGDNDSIVVKDAPSLNITDQLTIAAWIQPTKLGAQRILKKAQYDLVDGYELGLNPSGAVYVRFNQATEKGALTLTSETKAPIDGKAWTHVAATYDGSTIRIYVNGRLDAEKNAAFTIATNALPLTIGNEVDFKYGFGGKIDDVYLYAQALSEAKLEALAAAATGISLAGRWRFDQQQGDLLLDSSGSNNHITNFSAEPNKKLSPHGLGSALWLKSKSVKVAHADSLNPKEITMAAWIRPLQWKTQRILVKGGSAADGYELSLSSDGTVFARWNRKTAGNTYRVKSKSSYPKDGITWMHVAATYNGTSMRLYINGVLETSTLAQFEIGQNTEDLGIGGQPGNLYPFWGHLDDVQLYNTALCIPEIKKIAQQMVKSDMAGIPTDITAATSSSNQAKTWFYANRWWAVLPDGNGNLNIHRQDGKDWINSGYLGKNTGPVDTLAFNDKAYVLKHDVQNGKAYLYTLSHNASTNQYQPQYLIPQMFNLDGSYQKTPTLARDTSGKLWIAWKALNSQGSGYHCYVRHNEQLTLFPATSVANGLSSGDRCTIVALPALKQVGVLWSDATNRRHGFRTHGDGFPVGIWGVTEFPGNLGQHANKSYGTGIASGQMNVAVAADGRLYAAIKTNYNSKSNAPVIGLLVRHVDGTWAPFEDNYRVDLSDKTDPNGYDPSGPYVPSERDPVVVIDEIHQSLVVAYTSDKSGGDILYRRSPLWPIAFEKEKTLLSTGDTPLGMVTSTKQNTSAGIVFLASDADMSQPSGQLHSAYLGY